MQRDRTTTTNTASTAPYRTGDGSFLDPSHLLLELSREVTSTLDLQQVLDRTFRALRRLIDFGGGAIQLIEDGHLVAAATDPVMSEEARSLRIPVGQGISGTIAATGEPCYIPDIWDDPRIQPEGKRKDISSGVRTYFGAPLIQGGKPVGVLQIDAPGVDAFTPAERSVILAFLPTIAAAVQNAQVVARERETLTRLEEASQMKRDFLAIASHELRTPLTSVSGFAQTLASHAVHLDAQTVADIGHRIWRAGRRLERVMGDLLDLSNIERGALSVSMQPTDVVAVVRDAVREQAASGHAMVVEVDEEVPAGWTDEVRLHQIVGNILSNARKFSPPNSEIRITVAARAPSVEVIIEDEGRGIPPDMIEHIFQPFTQIEPAHTRTVEGLGVGLYLVRQLCERLGITVSVTSDTGEGSRFTLSIPTRPV